MKTFFDGIFISKEHLKEAGIKYPIKLEYYKIARDENVKNTNQISEAKNTNGEYGIEVVKTEYLEGNVKVESKEVNNITNDVKEASKETGACETTIIPCCRYKRNYSGGFKWYYADDINQPDKTKIIAA